MEPSAIIEIRKQLEALKQFQEKNAPKRLAYAGYVAEFIVGVYLLARVAFMNADVPSWAQIALFALGLFATCHTVYLLTRYHYDRRMITLLEKLLSESKPSNES